MEVELFVMMVTCNYQLPVFRVYGVDAGGLYNVNVSVPGNCKFCIFSGNNAITTGGAIRNSVNSDPAISNCIIWGNFAAGLYQCHIQQLMLPVFLLLITHWCRAATPVLLNINSDPLFVNSVVATLAPTLTGDYRRNAALLWIVGSKSLMYS